MSTFDDFADLHRPGDPFVLPNAWDVGSARALATAYPAIGTTSLGIASSHGLLDATGDARDATLETVAALIEADLGVLLTCDAEDGFGDDPDQVADLMAGWAAQGVVGVNIEDATGGDLVDPVRHAAKIRAVKQRAPSLFVNARTDVLWLGRGSPAEAVSRLQEYADAGADGVIVPGVLTPAAVGEVVAGTDLPVNVLAQPELTRSALADLGVARISAGSLPYRAALTTALAVAAAVRDDQAPPRAVGYDEVQDWHRGVSR